MAKKKTKLKVKEILPKEYKGYTLGQKIYCNRSPDGKLSYGPIYMFHPNDSISPCLTFFCEACGQYRLTTMDGIIDNPSKAQIASIKRSIQRINS